MEDTYRTQGIVLSRLAFREDDARITVYTPDRGKLTLVARGAKKIRSKLAAHIEPLCHSELMVVRGRGYDYLGSAASLECFAVLKNDFSKVSAAAKAVRTMNKLIKEGENDRTPFDLLRDFLKALDRSDNLTSDDFLAAAFLLKLLAGLGYRPELYNCAICGKKILPGKNFFDLTKPGVISHGCLASGKIWPLADDCIKILRLILEHDFTTIAKLKLAPMVDREAIKTIEAIFQYQFA